MRVHNTWSTGAARTCRSLFLAGALSALSLSSAHASDRKLYHGTECQEQDNDRPTIKYSTSGAYLDGSGNRTVICPILRDAPTGRDVTYDVTVSAIEHDIGSTGAPQMSCRVWSLWEGHQGWGAPAAATRSDFVYVTSQPSFFSSSSTWFDDAPVFLTCEAAGPFTIIGYEVNEVFYR